MHYKINISDSYDQWRQQVQNKEEYGEDELVMFPKTRDTCLEAVQVTVHT